MTKIKFNKENNIESYWGKKLEKELNYSLVRTRERQLEIIQNYIDEYSKDTETTNSNHEANFFKESERFLKKTFNELKNRKLVSFKIDKVKLEEQGIRYELFHIFIDDKKSILEMKFMKSRQFLDSVDFTDFCIKEFREFDTALMGD